VPAAKFWGARPSPWPAVASRLAVALCLCEGWLAKTGGAGEGVPPPSRTSHKKFRRRDTQRPTRGTRMRPNPRRAPRRTHYIHSTFLSSFDIRISSFDSSVLFAVNHTKKEAPGGVTLPVAVFSSEQLELSLAYFKPNLNRPYYGASPCLRRSSRSSRQSAPVLEDVTGHRPARATQR
jgi:hypothetical protein